MPRRGSSASRRTVGPAGSNVGSSAPRPGSVLILVVAVLVLLALIATAWLTTVRIDRQAVAQNSDNTEFDLLVDGVVNAESAAIVRRVMAPDGRFRPDGYPHVDGVGEIPAPQEIADQADPAAKARMIERSRLVDPNLADRLPSIANDTPYWPRISTSPFGHASAASQFESPRGGDDAYDTRTNVAPRTSCSRPGRGRPGPFPA